MFKGSAFEDCVILIRFGEVRIPNHCTTHSEGDQVGNTVDEICRRELALSELVMEAALQGDRELALQAMLLDPMVGDIDQARAVLEDLLQANAEWLPQFG